MAWIGWQAGMTGPPVAAAKRILKRKFSYAHQLNDDEFFGWDLQRVLAEYQRKKGGLRTDGVLDWNTQVALGTVAAPPKKPKLVGTLFTVAGTGATMWQGYPADVARAVEDVWFFQPVSYPAKAFPMAPSVDLGRAELKRLIRERPGPIALAGYSQGAMVTSMCLKHDLLNPKGELHDRLPDVIAGITYGNPCREQGVANGNLREGIPIPTGRGISNDRLENTPDWWLDFAHGDNSGFGKDIYTDTSPDEDVSEHMESIFRFVQNVSGFLGVNGLLEQITEMATNPTKEIPAVFRAVYFGGAFVTARPFATAPHCTYSIEPAIAYLRSFGKLS